MLIVASWQRFPGTFGLKGFTEKYPDSNKILSSIMGEKGLARRVTRRIDKFEPVGRSATMYASADDAAANADTSLINNVMFQLSVSFWLPTGFEYHTFR